MPLSSGYVADSLLDITPTLVDEGVQFAICGAGGAAIEARVRAVAASHPRHVAVRVDYEARDEPGLSLAAAGRAIRCTLRGSGARRRRHYRCRPLRRNRC